MCRDRRLTSENVTRWHPWRSLRALTHVECSTVDLPDDVLAWTHFSEQRIELARGLLQSERRSVLTHELIHLERGPVSAAYADSEERAVDAEAARRLIPLDALADALLWSWNEAELAEELWVGQDVVRERLDGLTVEEKAWIDGQIARKEESA